MLPSGNRRTLLLLILWRVGSVFVVQTAHVPDEYWQSLEVAHRLAFGYGHLTWEWTKRIRSYAYPYAVHLLYRLLGYLSLDHPDLLTKLPRVLQAILAGYGDYRFYVWTRSKWMLFSLCVNWYWYYCATRTLANSLETSLTAIALSYFPWKNGGTKDLRYFWIVGFLCMARPTAAVIWVPLCLYHLCTSTEKKLPLVSRYAIIAGACFALSVALDSYCYGAFVVTVWEFFRFNVLQGIGDTYGEQQHLWYLLVAFPVLLGIYYAIFFVAAWQILRHPKRFHRPLILLLVIVWTVLVYSFLGHKEFRFVLPLLPMAVHVCVAGVSQLGVRCTERARRFFVAALLLTNILPLLYFSLIHQRGTLDVLRVLRDDLRGVDPSTANILLLTPCHATPLYSHLHVDVPLRFLSCEPNLNGTRPYVDEADEFFARPNHWLELNYGRKSENSLPTHVIVFDDSAQGIGKFLANFQLVAKVFHTHFPQTNYGEYIHMYKRKLLRDGVK